jgi:hypothetical protein
MSKGKYMGLSIEVRAELFLDDLECINHYLREKGLPEYREPEHLPVIYSRAECTSFPYTFLHYLRRIYARTRQNPDEAAVPVSAGEDPTQDPVVTSEGLMLDSHLLLHSDCEGYYLPIDFREPIGGQDMPGGIAGSSYQLLKELRLTAKPLNIILNNGELSDQEAQRINDLGQAEGPLHREYITWLALYEAARLSILYGCVIRFV